MLLPLDKIVPLLNLVLTLLTIHSTSTYKPVQSPAEPIISGLAEHDLPQNLARAVLDLFGTVDVESGVWDVDIHRAVGEVGKGLLVELKGRTEGSEVFMGRWKDTVGETWAEYCDLKLLEVRISPLLHRWDNYQEYSRGDADNLGRAPLDSTTRIRHPPIYFTYNHTFPTTYLTPPTGYSIRRPLPHPT